MCVNQECFGSLEVINQLNPGEVGRPLNQVEGERDEASEETKQVTPCTAVAR